MDDMENEANAAEKDLAEEVANTEAEEAVKAENDKSSGQEKNFIGKKKQNAEIKKLNAQIEEKDKALSELKDRYTRLAAEYDNYKRRTAKELSCRYSDAKGEALKAILPVIDNFERAVVVEIPNGCEKYQEGVALILKQLLDILAANGVEEVAALGEEFDPDLHNAVMHIDDESVGANVIVEVFEKGYKMGDKVLRYSMVKVAN